MAPTEVLAEQHATGIKALLADLEVPTKGDSLFADRPLRVELLTNRVTGAERKRILAGLADGSVDLAIGTHALIQEGVAFHSLGVVVVDEQHRFGVEQRAALREKAGGGGPGRARDDGDADPAHRGDDGVRRPRRERARRAAAGPHADRDAVGCRYTAEEAGVGGGARRGGRRPPGLRRVPAHRGEREARGGVGRGDVRPAARRRARRAAPRAAARADGAGREGGDDGRLPRRRRSTCSSRRRSSRSASTSRTRR